MAPPPSIFSPEFNEYYWFWTEIPYCHHVLPAVMYDSTIANPGHWYAKCQFWQDSVCKCSYWEWDDTFHARKARFEPLRRQDQTLNYPDGFAPPASMPPVPSHPPSWQTVSALGAASAAPTTSTTAVNNVTATASSTLAPIPAPAPKSALTSSVAAAPTSAPTSAHASALASTSAIAPALSAPPSSSPSSSPFSSSALTPAKMIPHSDVQHNTLPSIPIVASTVHSSTSLASMADSTRANAGSLPSSLTSTSTIKTPSHNHLSMSNQAASSRPVLSSSTTVPVSKRKGTFSLFAPSPAERATEAAASSSSNKRTRDVDDEGESTQMSKTLKLSKVEAPPVNRRATLVSAIKQLHAERNAILELEFDTPPHTPEQTTKSFSVASRSHPPSTQDAIDQTYALALQSKQVAMGVVEAIVADADVFPPAIASILSATLALAELSTHGIDDQSLLELGRQLQRAGCDLQSAGVAVASPFCSVSGSESHAKDKGKGKAVA